MSTLPTDTSAEAFCTRRAPAYHYLSAAGRLLLAASATLIIMCCGGCTDTEREHVEERTRIEQQYSKLEPDQKEENKFEARLEEMTQKFKEETEARSLLQTQSDDLTAKLQEATTRAETREEQITQLLSLLSTYETQISVMRIDNPGLDGQIRMLRNRSAEARSYLDEHFSGRYKAYIPRDAR